MTLVGGQTVPAHSFGIVLRYALTEVVHETEVVLGTSVTLFGGQPEPFHGFGIVLEDALASSVTEPEGVLRRWRRLARQPAGTISRLRHRP